MGGGRRARVTEYARRINAAVAMLARGRTLPAAIRQLARHHQLSARQARRYVEHARDRGRVAVPEATVVFTVKLAAALVRRIRQHARRSGQTISAVVARALQQFLDAGDAGKRRGR
jgi:DNA-binding transcriptional regulator LsrR (DeoR family)